jgi:hypothetical protein
MKYLKLFEAFDNIPDPESMSANEWDKEVTNAQEVAFTQREKKLFISLSDTINVKNKINMPQIGESDLYFQLINGDLNPKLKDTTPIRNISTYKNDDEYYYVSVWGRSFGEKLYRCDGYECWEKLLRETFQEYKEFIDNKISEPEKFSYGDKWDAQFGKMTKFDQADINLFDSLCDIIPNEWRERKTIYDSRDRLVQDFEFLFGNKNGGYGLVFVSKTDEDYYLLEIRKYPNQPEYYKCDGFECMEKILRKTFDWFKEFASSRSQTNESFFDDIPDPEPMDENEWEKEVVDAKEVDFTQKEKELFISLSDTISDKHKIDLDALEIGDSQLSFSMVNGEDGIYPNLRSTTVIRSITSYKNDDEFYYVNVWEGNDIDGVHKSYRCDRYECWERFLKEIFQGYRELIGQTKTNESMFDYVPEPRSLLDENGDYIPGKSRDRMNNREPFDRKEKSFINQLLETLNEEYISTNFSDSSEFVLNMGEMGETTHGMRVVKMMDEYYEVQYNNFVDSDDEYIYCECDGFKCLSKLLIELFEKINKDYDYEG